MKKIFYFLLAISAICGISCSEYLEYEETDFLYGAAAYKTVENNESAIIGAYGGLSNLMSVTLNSVFSDEVKTAGEFYNSATVHEWQYGPQDVVIRDTYTAINPQYQMIDRVNRVLAYIDESDSMRTGDNKLRLKLKGEAYFLRAYAHFELLRFYCSKYSPNGIAMPYLESPSKDVTNDPQARIPMNTFFEKLNRDIIEAKKLLPNTITDISRANVAAANGLHARIALYSEDWEAAETYATNYISTTGLALADLTKFSGIWTDANTSEQAFRTVRSNSMARLGSIYRNTSANASNIGTVIWTVSGKLYNLYSDKDIRRTTYFKNEALLATAGRPSLLISKYAGGSYGTSNENVVNSKLMRTAEMYLIRAEARAEQGKISGANSAESDLNLLRTNRITGYTDIALATKEQAIEEIMLERFKELAFEGHRFWDLKRRSMPVSRLKEDAPTEAAQTLPANDFRFALPIPLTEMQANRLMTQNGGY